MLHFGSPRNERCSGLTSDALRPAPEQVEPQGFIRHSTDASLFRLTGPAPAPSSRWRPGLGLREGARPVDRAGEEGAVRGRSETTAAVRRGFAGGVVPPPP